MLLPTISKKNTAFKLQANQWERKEKELRAPMNGHARSWLPHRVPCAQLNPSRIFSPLLLESQLSVTLTIGLSVRPSPLPSFFSSFYPTLQEDMKMDECSQLSNNS